MSTRIGICDWCGCEKVVDSELYFDDDGNDVVLFSCDECTDEQIEDEPVDGEEATQ